MVKIQAKLQAMQPIAVDRAKTTCHDVQQRLNLTDADLKKIVMGLPQVLGLSYDANIEPSLAALQRRLDLSDPELKKIVLRLPPVLGLSYEANIDP